MAYTMAAPRPAPGAPSASWSSASTLRGAFALRADFNGTQGEVRAREAADELRRLGPQPESRQDLVPHDGCGGGGAGHHERGRELLDQLADLQVLRPKVVSPFADAVRLVDGQQRNADLVQQTTEARECQPFRGGVHQLVGAGGQPGHAQPHLAGVERCSQEGGRHAARLEGTDLVVHERDKR
jgi:hypothetical protein